MADMKVAEAVEAVDPVDPVDPVDFVVKPKKRKINAVVKEVVAPELTTEHLTPAKSEEMTWTDAARAAKTTGHIFDSPAADSAILKRIDARSEQRAFGLGLNGSDLLMAEFDVSEFLRISKESGFSRFAAVTIAANMQEYPDYKIRIFELDTQYPSLIKSIVEFNNINSVMVAAKETRKTAEMQPIKVGSSLDGEQSEFLGSADGVSVNTVDGGFAVSFPFDRQLSGMMDRVLNAVFNKESKTYAVPSGSAVQLAKVVGAMRVENRAIEAEFKSIKALANLTGLNAQKDHGTAIGAIPQISAFIDPGKAYRGEIVNANSRFVAQFSGFGKQDSAAFLTIHRLASLDNDRLLKGDKVCIVYDSKFRGAVSDLSRNMSAAELEADYESNQGQKVDGVTVSDRGHKIGIAFEINPNMVSRIRRVEGAAFNKDDKMWEIPKTKQEFALFAVQDLRNEFVADAKDVDELHRVAESKIDGAKVWPAFTRDGQEYFGTVLAVGNRYALQKSGRENFTLHHLSALDQEPIKGHNLEIQYKKGVGMVHDKDQQRGQDRGR